MERRLTPNCAQEPLEDPSGLAGRYLQFCSGHLGELQECIARRDPASVSRIARALKGNAARIGLSELSSLGHELQGHCTGPDWGAISSAHRAIAEMILELCKGTSLRVTVKSEPNKHARELNVRKACQD